MPQATTKTYQLFRETLLNATSEEHNKSIIIEEIVHQIGDEYHCDCEIEKIFRDINLEDVLKALKNYLGSYSREWDFVLDNWNLTKPAHLQPEETLLAIINLLK